MMKIIVVEDNDCDFLDILEKIPHKVRVMRAKTIDEGEKIFQENTDADLIIMDCCVPGSKPNTMPLVKSIKKSGFKNPIIATSSVFLFTEELMKAGATHAVDKNTAAKSALDLLGI